MKAYHFVGERLRDGRPVPPDGEWLVHDGPLVLCQSGLHASEHPFDALQYAPGPILCLVEIEGELLQQEADKLVGRCRQIVRRIDATDRLRQFARQCALDVIHLWDPPEVVRRYLTTGDETIRAAAEAAARAAGAVAWAAAWAAAEAAARAAGAVAWAAAWAAAEAAWAAAGAAARAAARAAGEATGDAAWAAAWAAASAAATAAQRDRFAALVTEAGL